MLTKTASYGRSSGIFKIATNQALYNVQNVILVFHPKQAFVMSSSSTGQRNIYYRAGNSSRPAAHVGNSKKPVSKNFALLSLRLESGTFFKRCCATNLRLWLLTPMRTEESILAPKMLLILPIVLRWLSGHESFLRQFNLNAG